MSTVLTLKIAAKLLAKAKGRAAQLGLDRAGYVRRLIERDLGADRRPSGHRFASEDLVGAFRVGGKSATNEQTRKALRRRAVNSMRFFAG